MEGILTIADLNLPENFKYREVEKAELPICTICSDCCMCETGGV